MNGLDHRTLNREVLGSNLTDGGLRLGRIVYPTFSMSLGMLLVYPKRMTVGVKPRDFYNNTTGNDNLYYNLP